ncbi:MAG TPA: Crp/Fnr family transcriptional regulator [Bacteroidales bacterium]|nr:Crp/Fnr family transcriptional regulator [Bacteroidales bacterium]
MNQILTKCALFSGIEDAEIKKIFDGIFYQTKEYVSGDIVAYQDEKVEFLMIVLEGVVRGEMVDASRKVIVIEEIESPRPLAPAFVFGMNNLYPVNIVAQTETKIVKIPKAEFVKMMQRSDKLLINYMNNVSGRAQFLSQKLKFLSFHSIKGKFAYYILNLAKNNNRNFVTLPLSQEKLAELFGVTRPSLARAIREMHNDGLIRAEAKNIQILNTYELYELMK